MLAQLSCASQYQQGLIFRVQYKPETKYSQTIEQTSQSEIKYIGSKEFLQTLKDKNILNPTITKSHSIIEAIVSTGKLIDGMYFPLRMEFIKTTSNDGKTIIPNGTIIYGKSTVGNVPTLDSITSTGLNEEYKKVILQTMRGAFAQIKFPDKKLKVGDEFTIDSPLSIPIAEATVEMAITTNYKLISILNGIADFDISQVYAMKSKVIKYPIKATGNGKGKLLYDIANNFWRKYQIETEMEMNTTFDNFKLDTRSSGSLTQTTVITTK
jgi:hypothetical protein